MRRTLRHIPGPAVLRRVHVLSRTGRFEGSPISSLPPDGGKKLPAHRLPGILRPSVGVGSFGSTKKPFSGTAGGWLEAPRSKLHLAGGRLMRTAGSRET